jgi:hypothetical protein
MVGIDEPAPYRRQARGSGGHVRAGTNRLSQSMPKQYRRDPKGTMCGRQHKKEIRRMGGACHAHDISQLLSKECGFYFTFRHINMVLRGVVRFGASGTLHRISAGRQKVGKPIFLLNVFAPLLVECDFSLLAVSSPARFAGFAGFLRMRPGAAAYRT